MTELAAIDLNRKGEFKSAGDKATLEGLAATGVTDLLVLCHGWKNTGSDAQANFSKLWEFVVNAWEGPMPALAPLIVVWPAKQFRTSFDDPALHAAGAGGAASAGGAGAVAEDLKDDDLSELVDDLVDALDLDPQGDDVKVLRQATLAINENWVEQDISAFFAAFRNVIDIPSGNADEFRDDLNLSKLVDPTEDPIELLETFMDPVGTLSVEEGQAAGLGGLLTGVFDTARGSIGRMLNQGTYFYMKRRAGVVGTALSSHLGNLSAPALRNIHLVGHSFGGRLVAACADVADQTALKEKLRSLTILQGAFSHNAFASQTPSGIKGGFRNILAASAVSGPIVVTHTHNDKAVTVAYALASRLSGENADSVGGPNSQFGGIGANGALHLQSGQYGPARKLRPSGRVNLKSGKVHNLRADHVIDNHNDVYDARIGELLAQVLAV